MDSPRGRLYLMRGLVEGRIEATPSVLTHLDRCLDCRACETACPSTVAYGEILEKTRSVLQPSRPLGWLARFWRWLALQVVLPSRGAQSLMLKLAWVLQRTGLMRFARWLADRRILPRWVGQACAPGIAVPLSSFRQRHATAFDRRKGVFVFPAKGERRKRVALLTGCIADHLLADLNDASVRVLTENGCDVEVVGGERCCGALHIHNGARNEARLLARDNVRQFLAGDYDAIVSNAAGCSAELRRYGELLAGDAQAHAFAAKVRDICEFLFELGPSPPAASPSTAVRVAYADPCHLVHAQKISEPPRRVLEIVRGVSLVALDEADACCGGAGAYFLLQPDLARRIVARKLDAIARSGADVVATGNPGCLIQIRSALRAAGVPVRVVHPVELLAAAYSQGGATRP
jgi:glycolate oxidase iron-sulfur subunit